MRVDCYKCGAAYKIPDEAVGPGGVRAECPRCGFQETVRSSGAVAAAPVPPPPSPPPPAATSFGTTEDLSLDPEEESALDSPGATDRDELFDFRNVPSAAAPSARDDDDPFADLDTGGPSRQGTPGAVPAAAGPAGPGPNGYRVKKPDGRILGPVSFDQLDRMAASGEVAPGDQIARDADEFRLMSQYAECAPLLEKAAAHFRVRTARVPYQPEPRRRLPLLLLAGAVAAILLLVAGVARFSPALLPESVRAPLVSLVGAAAPEGPVNPVRDQVALYRLQLVDVSGTAEEHLEQARARMAEDTAAAYREADAALKRALVLDPDHPEAVARFVLNTAYRERWQADVPTLQNLQRYAGYLESVAPGDPMTPLARAAVHLLHGPASAPEARASAQAALQRSPGSLEAKLVLARATSYIDHDAAISMLDELAKGAPSRALIELGHVCREAGDFACAEGAFRERLVASPGHEEATAELARLYVLLGRYGEARAVYQNILTLDADRVDADLAIARLDYQLMGRSDEAWNRLERLRGERLALAEPEVARMVQVHAATLARLRGDTALAQELVDAVLASEKVHGPAAYQGVILAELRGDHQAAKDLLASVAALSEDRSSTQALSALVSAGNGELDAAIRQARSAADGDPNGLRWLMLAAALEGQRGRPQQAYLLMRHVVRIDPAEAVRARTVSDYYDGGLIEAAILRGFEALVKADPDQGLAHAGLGISRFLAGQTPAARKAFEVALELDAENFPAHLYLGQMAMQAGDAVAARKAFALAVRADRLAPLARYLLGRSYEVKGQLPAARKQYREALRLDPNFHLAEVRVTMLDAGRGNKDAVRRKLRDILAAHPDSMAARLALYDVQ